MGGGVEGDDGEKVVVGHEDAMGGLEEGGQDRRRGYVRGLLPGHFLILGRVRWDPIVRVRAHEMSVATDSSNYLFS